MSNTKHQIRVRFTRMCFNFHALLLSQSIYQLKNLTFTIIVEVFFQYVHWEQNEWNIFNDPILSKIACVFKFARNLCAIHNFSCVLFRSISLKKLFAVSIYILIRHVV